jgi:drug/metabolite transporter (DMT)-like permease
VVFVPLIGLFLGHRATWSIWIGALLAAAGLYLLSAKGMTGIDLGDGLVLISALFWAGHVLLIARLVRTVDPVQLAVAQFTVVSVASLIGAAIFENPALGPILEAAVPILYAGLMSVGVAYTLQVIAQRHARPAHAAIILSMESVFAATGGWLLLDENLPLRGLIGCALMLGGVLLVQFEGGRRK